MRVGTIQDAISAIKKTEPSLVIVDVEIEKGAGFRVFEETREVMYEKIILTATPDHVLKSIRFDVAQYLLKPLDPDEIHAAILSAMFKQRKNGIQQLYKHRMDAVFWARLSQLFVPVGGKQVLVEVRDLVLLEDIGHLRRLWMADGGIWESMTSIQRFAKLLSGHAFEWEGSTCLFHPLHVKELCMEKEGVYARMGNGRRILVGYPVECRIRHQWRLNDYRPRGPRSA